MDVLSASTAMPCRPARLPSAPGACRPASNLIAPGAASLCSLEAVCRPSGSQVVAVASRRAGHAVSARRVACQAASTLESTSTPNIVVQGRNIKLTSSLREFATERIARALKNFNPAIKEVDVKLSVSGGNRGRGDEKQKCEITIYLYRLGVVRAEDVEENLYAAIEKVSDVVVRKMRKTKEKAILKGKWEGSAGPRGHSVYKELPEEVASDEEDIDLDALPPPFPSEVVRTKTLGLRPMTMEEALDQTEQLGHNFFIWRDVDDKIKVLYKREHRGYGVIIPQFLS